MMTFPTCFWALLSQKDLSFVYLSPWLSKSLGAEHELLLGTSFFDYFHPDTLERARHDLSEMVKKKSTLSCSVTRCQYNTIQTIRKKLQQSMISSSKSSLQQISSQYSPAPSTMTSPNYTSTTIQQSDDEYIVMDVGMNVVSQDIVLACFHSDDVKQSNSNCVSSTCGETEFTQEEINKLTSLMHKHAISKVQTPPSTPFPEVSLNNETPNRIFQILDRKSRNLIFTWPDANDHNSNNNISYNKYEFSRLLKNVILDQNNRNGLVKETDDAESPSCYRLISDKHFIETLGTFRQVESIVIPYGDIIFACFLILPSTMLGVSSIFSKPKARSAPCSPANNNGVVKRPRSPGSLSPLPSPFYDDEIRRYIQNHHNSSTICLREVPDFTLEKRSSKRHRIESPPNDSVVPVKISSSPPNTPHNLISPRISPSYHDQQQRCSQPQFPFPQIVTSEDVQPPQTLQPSQQPYYPHVSPPPPPQQSRQPSPKQQDYPSPTNSQFLNRNIASNHHMVQPQQPPPSSQSQAVVVPSPNQPQRFAQFAPRRNNGNSGNNNNNNNSNSNNNNVQGAKKCESCHTSSSPEWRRGPTGHKTLCNACGLRYSRTIARENRKREQAQREQEQRQREQREREERARERAAATVMMQRAIEPFPQYRPSNAMMTPGQQQHHPLHSSTHSSHPSGPQQYHPSTLPPLNYLNNQPQLPQPQTSHHQHHLHNQHHHSQQPLNDRGRYTLPTLPSPHLFDRQQNGAGGIGNNGGYNPVVTDNHRRDHNGESERYNTNMMNNMPPTANAYPKEAYFGRAQ